MEQDKIEVLGFGIYETLDVGDMQTRMVELGIDATDKDMLKCLQARDRYFQHPGEETAYWYFEECGGQGYAIRFADMTILKSPFQ